MTPLSLAAAVSGLGAVLCGRRHCEKRSDEAIHLSLCEAMDDFTSRAIAQRRIHLTVLSPARLGLLATAFAMLARTPREGICHQGVRLSAMCYARLAHLSCPPHAAPNVRDDRDTPI